VYKHLPADRHLLLNQHQHQHLWPKQHLLQQTTFRLTPTNQWQQPLRLWQKTRLVKMLKTFWL
jgi:hypothetical protein